MIVTFLRSSSIGSFSLCPQSYFIEYVLKIKGPGNKSAHLGNVLHKAMETLAWVSYWTARGVDEFDDETFGRVRVGELTPEQCCHLSYIHYRKLEPEIRWNDSGDPTCETDRRLWRQRLEQGADLDLYTPKKQADKLRPRSFNDYVLTQIWTMKALAWDDGHFDPRNQNVVAAEQKFDFLIDEPWARYSYETPEGVFEGQLGIKGTMDLICRIDESGDTLELIDYKSGRRIDWGEADETKNVKDYGKLMKDKQLLLYYYATRRLFPDVKNIIVTIFFVNDGGPFSLAFGPREEAAALRMIRENFEAIRDMETPVLNVGTPCWTFCPHGKRSKWKDDESLTVCEAIRRKVLEQGADRVFYEIGNMGNLGSYSDGGGRRNQA